MCTCEQLPHLHVGLGIGFLFLLNPVLAFCALFSVSVGHFCVHLFCLGFVFSVLVKRLAGENVSDMTCFVSNGTQISINSINEDLTEPKLFKY